MLSNSFAEQGFPWPVCAETLKWESDGSLPLLDKEAVSDMLTEEE